MIHQKRLIWNKDTNKIWSQHDKERTGYPSKRYDMNTGQSTTQCIQNDVLRRILSNQRSTWDMLQTFPYFPLVTMFSSMFKDTSVWGLGSNLVIMLQLVCHLQSNQFKSVLSISWLFYTWTKRKVPVGVFKSTLEQNFTSSFQFKLLRCTCEQITLIYPAYWHPWPISQLT